MYAHWLLTDAQGSTFVDVEMGMQPKSSVDKVFDAVVGRLYFRRWLDQSLDALRSKLEALDARLPLSGGGTPPPDPHPWRFQLSCSASPMMMPSGPRRKQSR